MIVLDGFVEFHQFASNEVTRIQLQWQRYTIQTQEPIIMNDIWRTTGVGRRPITLFMLCV